MDYFIVRYELDDGYAEAVIEITDMAGRLIWQHQLVISHDYIVIPTEGMKSGIYIAKLLLNGQERGSQKISIRR